MNQTDNVAASRPRPIALVILDGWGINPAVRTTPSRWPIPPIWTRLWEQYPHTELNASEHFVGLPEGQMGNSESATRTWARASSSIRS